MRLAANARIIVQCFLKRLPFVWEDHTVWLAPNKTVHSMGSIEGREGACGQAAAGVKGKASKPSWNSRPYPCRSTIEGISPAVGQRDGLGLRISMGQLPLTPITLQTRRRARQGLQPQAAASNYGRDPPRSMTVITRTLPARSALSPTATSLVPEHGLGIVSVINGDHERCKVLYPRPMQVQVFFIHVASLPT